LTLIFTYIIAQVPPIVKLLTQPNVPMFVTSLAFELVKKFDNCVVTEMCKVAALPSSIATFVERVCDDPVTQNSIADPRLFVLDSIAFFCRIVIKCCSSGGLRPSGSDSNFSHAQSLRSTCLRLLTRFMPLPVQDAAVVCQPSFDVDLPTCVPAFV
jgi:hypothetical protein